MKPDKPERPNKPASSRLMLSALKNATARISGGIPDVLNFMEIYIKLGEHFSLTNSAIGGMKGGEEKMQPIKKLSDRSSHYNAGCLGFVGCCNGAAK